MKIVLDFRKYDGVAGGVEQGAKQIVLNATMEGHKILMVCKKIRLEQIKELFGGEHKNLTLVPVDIESHAISRQNADLDSHFFQDLAEKENADIIHFFYNWSFPSVKKVPCVLTLHDVIPYTFREAMGWFRNVFIYKKAIRKACRLNDVVVTVSEYSKQDIANKVGVPLSKIRVVYNGLRTPAEKDPDLQSQLEQKFNLQNGFMLNIGGIHERKNIPRLIQAFAKVVSNEDYKGNLLITGSVSGAPYQEKMRKICHAEVVAAGLEGQVVFTGFIPDDELDILLNQASMLIYPSLYEGFGIPILEAMHAGIPVITSNMTAMPEIAGDAGMLVDPLSFDDMAAAMSQLLKDDALRTDLISKGKNRVAGFSWEKNWNEYLALYQELCRI